MSENAQPEKKRRSNPPSSGNLHSINLSSSEVPDETPTDETRLELQDLESQAKLDPHQWEDIKNRQQDRKQRHEFGNKLLNLTRIWLGGIGGVLLAQGFLSPWGVFQLGDGVLLALIGGTTANVLGLLYVVARYLFPRGKV